VHTSPPRQRVPATPGARLKEARIKAGYQTVEDAAIAIGVAYRDSRGELRGYATYAQHESGHRSISPRSAESYARHFHTDASYLLYGTVTGATRIPVRGVIGAEGKVLKARAGESIEAPPPEGRETKLASFRIADPSLRPFFGVGDVVVYDEAIFAKPLDLSMVDGVECLVQLASGTIGVFIVDAQRNGAVILHPHKGAVIRNAAVQRASPVQWIRRAQKPR